MYTHKCLIVNTATEDNYIRWEGIPDLRGIGMSYEIPDGFGNEGGRGGSNLSWDIVVFNRTVTDGGGSGRVLGLSV